MKPENFIASGAALFCMLVFEAIALWCFLSKKTCELLGGRQDFGIIYFKHKKI